jgi:phage gp36-like protein
MVFLEQPGVSFMSLQTYCTAADLEAIWDPDLLLASVDDDEDSALSELEQSYIDRAIERAAGRMNAYLEVRYTLSALANNPWCRDANAAIAVYLLSIRRGEPAPAVLQEQYDAYFHELSEVAAGRLNVAPGANPFGFGPSVTNFRFDVGESRARPRP